MSVDPYQPPAAHVADPRPQDYLEVTWSRAIKVWWSLAWRAVLFSFLAGAAVGFVVGVVLGAAQVSPVIVSGVTSILGILVGIPVGIWVTRMVLRKSWSDFRIVLLPAAPG